MRVQSAVAAGIAGSLGLLGLLAAPSSCGTADDRGCPPGLQIRCDCPGGPRGVMACRQDGSGFDECVCQHCEAFGLTTCSTGCTDLSRDSQNCGRCELACDLAAHSSCVAGMCACVAPFLDCSGTCADTRHDRQHCGECGRACAEGEVCADSACTADHCALQGLALCGEECVNLANDQLHCGQCDLACGDVEICQRGACEVYYPSGCEIWGLLACPGECVEPWSDPRNCGGCGIVCGDPTPICRSGTCQAGP
jgi:hypothetical protein